MLTSKQTNLKPLLESKDGVHLTAYLVNRGDLIDLKSQLRTTIREASEWLHEAMSSSEREKFLEPLEHLLRDDNIFRHMKGNIGIFRNEEIFRVLNIPIDIQQTCQVATSFHVKPLLRWLQVDREFLFLGLDHRAAHLYHGSQSTFKLIDSILFPDLFKGRTPLGNESSASKLRRARASKHETYVWLNEWIVEVTQVAKPKLFVAGEPSLTRAFYESLKYSSVFDTPIASVFAVEKASEYCQVVRNLLKVEAQETLQRALLEFRFAEEGKRARKNIFQIARAVVQGRVRKLIVTDDLSIFGRIDQDSGGLAIHPFDLDHEDDCILDDLAQIVLSQGGEVVVARRDEIPKGRPILAILDEDAESLAKTEKAQYEVLLERFG